MAHMALKGADPAVSLCPHARLAWQGPFCYQPSDKAIIPRQTESRNSPENGIGATRFGDSKILLFNPFAVQFPVTYGQMTAD